MENDINTNTGMGDNNMGKKKNNSVINIIIIIIILAIIAIVVFRKINPVAQPLSQSDIELNQAITSDTTKSITDNINSIDLNDTSDADLISVDEELGKL